MPSWVVPTKVLAALNNGAQSYFTDSSLAMSTYVEWVAGSGGKQPW